MRRVNAVMVALAAVAISTTLALAQADKGTQPAASGKPATKDAALSGSIAAYDAKANTLTVKAESGSQIVYLAAHTKVHEGSKTLKTSELARLTGRSVKVRYTESGGKMTADTVTVGPAAAAK